MNFSNLCRSCMAELTENDPKTYDQNSVNMFVFCTNIQISEQDSLSNQFCQKCTFQINIAYKYIKNAQEVNEKLKNLVLENRESKICSQYDNNLLQDFDTNLDGVEDNLAFEHNEDKKPVEYESRHDEENLESFITKRKRGKPRTFPEKSKKKQIKANKESKTSTEINATETKPSNSKDYNKTTDDIENEITLNYFVLNIDTIENKNVFVEKKEEQCKQDIINHIDQNSKTTFVQKQIICQVCRKQFTSNRFLLRHMKSKHISYKLSQSEKEIARSGAALRNKDEKICPVCSKPFRSQVLFDRHLESHSRRKDYFCQFCAKIFPSATTLRRHKNNHTEDKKYFCNVCGKSFKLRKGLVVHALTHSDDRPFMCDICHMTFKMKQVLVKHVKTHDTDRSYLCHICAKAFKINKNLQEHMTTHTGERSFACSLCSFRARFRSSLHRHTRRRHHDARTHECDQCRKAFYDRESLKRHMRIHTGERPYKCPNCPLSFIDHWKRKIHLMNTHQMAFDEIPRLNRDGQPSTSG